MEFWKIWGRLLIIQSFFTCITLIHCRNLLRFSGTEKTNNEGGEDISEKNISDHKGYFEPLADFDHLGDNAGVSGM